MAASTCVVTGGAGFIGCALSTGLVGRFDRIIVLDKLHPQIHAVPERPVALDKQVEFRRADVTEPTIWDKLLAEVRPSSVVHLAAETGTGQSLTEASRHGRENVLGTTVMLDAFARHNHVPSQIVLCSSRAVYGEGAWRDSVGAIFYPGQRGRDQLARAEWDFAGASHVPFTAAVTEARPTSVYGATKLAQEHILRAWGGAFGTSLTVLRLQNVYGPGQSLVNSYTGIVSLFARLAREGRSIPLYEDGLMLRDFVYIEDVVSAVFAALDGKGMGGCLDVGTGAATTIRDVSEFMAARYGAPAPRVSGDYRHGDVRHASCDIGATKTRLHWKPEWPLERGLEALCLWIDARLSNN